MDSIFAVCLQELHAVNAISSGQLLEASKLAAVSTEEARRSLDRLDSLERTKPTAGQFGRYTGIGGVAGAAAGAIGNAIEHGGALKGGSPKAKLLNVAANTAKGALAGGAVPLLRNHLDRRAEMGTLHNFMNEKVASAAWTVVLDRLRKEAAIVPRLMSAARALPGAAKTIATGATEAGMHKNEIAGLGVLAVPGLDTLQASARARFAGDKGHDAVEKRHLLGEGAHAALDVGGLGMLAAPAVAHLKHAFAQSNYSGNVAQNPPGMRGHSALAPFTAPELETKKAGVEEMLTKKLRAEGKSAEEADRLIGEGKTAFNYEATRRYIYAHFVGPEKTAGALGRAAELLTGSKAKALSSAAADHGAAAVAKIKNRVTPEGASSAGDMLKHLQSTSASAGRERRAAGRIGDLAAKEHGAVNKARAVAGAAAVGGAAAAMGSKKEAGVFQRAGELVTGSKLKKLRSANETHVTKAVGAFRTALRGGQARDAMKAAPDLDTYPRGREALDYISKKTDKAVGTARHETNAARKIKGLHTKELKGHLRTKGALTIAATTAPVVGLAGIAKHNLSKSKEKEAGVGVGAGMTASQYSGPLSLGSFKMVSGAPPYSEPELERKKTASFFGELTYLMKSAGAVATSASLAERLRKLKGSLGSGRLGGTPDYLKEVEIKKLTTKLENMPIVKKAFTGAAMGPMHAAGKLHTTASVGAPRTTAPPGPSIAEIAKPKGFGTPLSGAKKNAL